MVIYDKISILDLCALSRISVACLDSVCFAWLSYKAAATLLVVLVPVSLQEDPLLHICRAPVFLFPF